MRFLNFAILLFLFSCGSNKPKIASNSIKDSIYITNTITQIQEVKDTLIIDNPCDSNGILKDFKFKGKVSLEGKNGKLIQTIYLPKIVYKDSVRIQIKNQEIIKEIRVKNPINTFLFYVSLISVGIIVGFLFLKRIIP